MHKDERPMEIVDISNTIRPFALLEIADYLKRLAPGKEVEIVGLDAAGLHDLRCILPAQENAVTQMDVLADEDGSIVIRIKKCAT